MTFNPKTKIINIPRKDYSYGFKIKDEGCAFNGFAVVAKINEHIIGDRGLKVGDRIIEINDIKVDGKNYVSILNNIRNSLNNCVKLEVLDDCDTTIFNEKPTPKSSSEWKVSSFIIKKWFYFIPWLPVCSNDASQYYGNHVQPPGLIRERISLYQNTVNERINRTYHRNRSSSLDCINILENLNNNNLSTSNHHRHSIPNLDNLWENENFSTNEPKMDGDKTVSQEPFNDDPVFISNNVVISMPSVLNPDENTKYNKHIDNPDQMFPSISEPTEENLMTPSSIQVFEPSDFYKNCSLSINSLFSKQSSVFGSSISRSSTNIGDSCNNHADEMEYSTHSESISMTDINSCSKESPPSNSKFYRQASVAKFIPIKLRIVQFYDKSKSKSWRDYVIERIEGGILFRKRVESPKHDVTNSFSILKENLNTFEIESPQRRYKQSSGSEVQVTEFSSMKYYLAAFDRKLVLRFHFNPNVYEDSESSNDAFAVFNSIISMFSNHMSLCKFNHCLSQNSVPMTLSDSHESVSLTKEPKDVFEDHNLHDHHRPSASYSVKSTSKSSIENVSNTNSEQNVTKNIFKQAIGKIIPEKRVKVTYEIFTGTKAEFEEFKKQLESGNLPPELDSGEEDGIHFNKYVHEVPRIPKYPKVPMIIYLCTEIVEKCGLSVEGIYRISGNRKIIRSLSTNINRQLTDIDPDMIEWTNIHAVCDLLKLFFRRLKEFLIPADLSHKLAISCKTVDSENANSLSKALLDIRYHLASFQNPSRKNFFIKSNRGNDIEDQIECRWQSLCFLLKHLSNVVAYRKYNCMDEHALAVCFNPVIMESWQKNINDIKADNEIRIKALELIITHQKWLFDCISLNPLSSQVVDDVKSYSTKFVESKYLDSISDDPVPSLNNEEFNVNRFIRDVLSQANGTTVEKRKIERRHSSHTPGQKPDIKLPEVDKTNAISNHRNSQTAEALDLLSCVNILTQIQNPSTDDRKKLKPRITYIQSQNPTENVSVFHMDETDDVTYRQNVHSIPSNRIAMDFESRIPRFISQDTMSSDNENVNEL